MAPIPPDGEKKTVEVPLATLEAMQKQMAELEIKLENEMASRAGLEEMFAKGAGTEGETKLRERKTYEPKFRTVRLRKYPVAGDFDNQAFVIGWTNRGAYQDIIQTGMGPQKVDFIDVMFLGHEKNDKGKLKAEKIQLLDFLNKGEQVHCKILDMKKTPRVVPTGEEIDVTTWDPQHGLVATGDKIDGYTAYSDIVYTLQVPGVDKPLEIDGMFVN